MLPEHVKQFDEVLTKLYDKLDLETKVKVMTELETLFWLVGYYTGVDKFKNKED